MSHRLPSAYGARLTCTHHIDSVHQAMYSSPWQLSIMPEDLRRRTTCISSTTSWKGRTCCLSIYCWLQVLNGKREAMTTETRKSKRDVSAHRVGLYTWSRMISRSWMGEWQVWQNIGVPPSWPISTSGIIIQMSLVLRVSIITWFPRRIPFKTLFPPAAPHTSASPPKLINTSAQKENCVSAPGSYQWANGHCYAVTRA